MNRERSPERYRDRLTTAPAGYYAQGTREVEGESRLARITKRADVCPGRVRRSHELGVQGLGGAVDARGFYPGDGASGMDSNLRPTAYKAVALPAELHRHVRLARVALAVSSRGCRSNEHGCGE